MFNLEESRNMFGIHDGEYSLLYPYIKDRLTHYPDEMLPFPDTFLFFEDKYFRMKDFILRYNMKFDEIVDIGCQLGIQSVLFDEFNYHGIDGHNIEKYFFNNEKTNVNYTVGLFPNAVKSSLENKVVISCMSLGYFENDIEDKNILSLSQLKSIEKLKKSKYLFVSSTELFNNELKKYFKHVIPMYYSFRYGDKNYDLYLMTNEELIEDSESNPQTIDSYNLVQETIKIHYNKEDFVDGDILKRIEENDFYNLRYILIDEIKDNNHYIDDDMVNEYVDMDLSQMPPIILGASNQNVFHLIDGGHRIATSVKKGEKRIWAYVSACPYIETPKLNILLKLRRRSL